MHLYAFIYFHNYNTLVLAEIDYSSCTHDMTDIWNPTHDPAIDVRIYELSELLKSVLDELFSFLMSTLFQVFTLYT